METIFTSVALGVAFAVFMLASFIGFMMCKKSDTVSPIGAMLMYCGGFLALMLGGALLIRSLVT